MLTISRGPSAGMSWVPRAVMWLHQWVSAHSLALGKPASATSRSKVRPNVERRLIGLRNRNQNRRRNGSVLGRPTAPTSSAMSNLVKVTISVSMEGHE
ncbi:MAG: hypothetical protein OEY18_18585 [Candidatus Aminicenantes bacterium]|nr:hypothetical protein [Candidatus Aminicenantes bacterium]